MVQKKLYFNLRKMKIIKRNSRPFVFLLRRTVIMFIICHEVQPNKDLNIKKDTYIFTQSKLDKSMPKKFSLENNMMSSPFLTKLEDLTH